MSLIVVSIKNTQDSHHNDDNNLFIQVEEQSLAVKNTGAEGDLMRTFQSEVLHGDKCSGREHESDSEPALPGGGCHINQERYLVEHLISSENSATL